MSKLTDKLNILIMPTDMCNMNCIYCFHAPYHKDIEKMTIETVRKIYDITFKDYSDVSIIWHGGEPLLMGIDFYREAINLQKEYNAIITNRIQTNLTLMTDEFAEFLCSNNIGVGSSYDGCRNECLRGNSNRILAGRKKILQKGKKCSFIMVVSKMNCDTLIDSYNYFKEINANFTLNTYVPTGNCNDSRLELDPKHTIVCFSELFDYWINDSNCNIHIDYFERILKFIITGEKSVCKYNSCLGKWIGISHNGDISPCNRYFPEKYSYGNIHKYTSITEVFESNGFNTLLNEAILRREKCKECIVFPLCSGGCNNVALTENGVENNGGNSCLIFQGIYTYILKRTIKIIQTKDDNICKNYYVNKILKNHHKIKSP